MFVDEGNKSQLALRSTNITPMALRTTQILGTYFSGLFPQKRFIFVLKHTITSIDDEPRKKVHTHIHKHFEHEAHARRGRKWKLEKMRPTTRPVPTTTTTASSWKKEDKWRLSENKHDDEQKKWKNDDERVWRVGKKVKAVHCLKCMV